MCGNRAAIMLKNFIYLSVLFCFFVNARQAKPQQLQAAKVEEINCTAPQKKIDADGFDVIDSSKLIDYQQCQKRFSYTLDRLLWGYQTIQSCPSLQNKAGRKRSELSKVSDCLKVYEANLAHINNPDKAQTTRRKSNLQPQKSHHFVAPSNQQLYQLLNQYIPIYEILDAISRYLESPVPSVAKLQNTPLKGSKKFLTINIPELLLKFEQATRSVELNPDKKDDLKVLKAQKILLFLIDSLIPQISPDLKILVCGNKRMVIDTSDLRQNPVSFFDIFPKVISFIESSECTTNQKKKNYQVFASAMKKVNLSKLAQEKDLEKKTTLNHPAKKALQNIDQETNINTLVINFLKALSSGQTSFKTPHKKFHQSRKTPWQGKDKVFASDSFTVDTEKLLKLLTALPTKEINDSRFARFFSESVISVLEAEEAKTMPDALQKQIITSKKPLTDSNLLSCTLKKSGQNFYVLHQSKKCQSLEYALSQVYRLFAFAKNCKANAHKPITHARSCLEKALNEKPIKSNSYLSLKKPLELLSTQMPAEEAMKSFTEALQKIDSTGRFSSTLQSYGPKHLTNRSKIGFSITGLVKHVRKQTGKSLEDDIKQMAAYKNPKTQNQIAAQLAKSEPKEAMAVLDYIAHKVQMGLSEKVICPSTEQTTYINRFACFRGAVDLLANLYDIVAFEPKCQQSLAIQKSKLLSKCFAYFEQGSSNNFENILSNKKFKDLNKQRLHNFLEQYFKAVKTFSSNFTVVFGESSQTYQVRQVNTALQNIKIPDHASQLDKAHKVLAVISRLIQKGE